MPPIRTTDRRVDDRQPRALDCQSAPHRDPSGAGGHTLTIVAVGAAIILFDLAIPARVGLTMEFSVGLMLILLAC